MRIVKWYLISVSFLAINCLGINLVAQNSLKEILHSSRDFAEITTKADTYFAKKHPNLTPFELTTGDHRDGEFVKYMRWQAFWQKRLTPEGQLGSLVVKPRKNEVAQNRNGNPYKDIPWRNISHQKPLRGQASMGRTTSIGFHPTNSSIFYVGAAMGGIWKTENGGLSYVPLGDDLPFLAVSAIVVNANNPSTIYIAVSDHAYFGPGGIGVYRSTDAGLTWQATALTFDFADDIRIFWMESCPVNPNKVFVGTSEGLYKTNDGFTSVEKINDISTSSIRFKPNDHNTIYQGGDCGEFLKSTDGGKSFTLIRDFNENFCYSAVFVIVNPTDPERLYLRHKNRLYKSYDGGNSFLTNSARLPAVNMVSLSAPNNPDILIGGNIEIYRSDDDGANFHTIGSWHGRDGTSKIHVDQRNIFTNPLEPDFIYFCNDGGVVKYQVSTNWFRDLSNGLIISQFYDIAVAQTNANVVAGGTQDNGNMFRNTDGKWQEYTSGGDGMTQAIDPTDHTIRYWTYQYGDMHRWQNGINENISPPNLAGNGAWETPFRLDPNNPNCIIAGYRNVFKSIDRGDSWEVISPTLGGSDLTLIAMAPTNSNRIYAGNAKDIFVKDLRNNTWTRKIIPNIKHLTDLEVDSYDMNTIYVSNSFVGAGRKVLKSTDAGDNWIDITGNLPDYPVASIEMYPNRPGGIFAGTFVGVFYKDDTLEDWVEIGELPHTLVEDIEINYQDALIRVGTYGRGIFEASIASIAPSSIPTNISDKDLFELYPNPVNNIVTLRFKEAAASRQITIYNKLGQILMQRTVVGQAAGAVVQFDVAQMPVGAYMMTVIREEVKQIATVKYFVKLP